MLILIDLDGTLINPFKRYYAIHKYLTKKYDLPPLSFEEYIESKRNRKLELFYLDKEFDVREKYLIERLRLIEDPKFLALDSLYPKIKQTLNNISQKNILALVTGRKKRKYLIAQLESFKLNKYFQKVYSQIDPRMPEEGADIKIKLIKRALEENKNNSAVLIGDTEADIVAGKKIGLVTVAIENGFRTKKILQDLSPTFIVRDLQEAWQKVSSL